MRHKMPIHINRPNKMSNPRPSFKNRAASVFTLSYFRGMGIILSPRRIFWE